ncbi:hypothetical protein B0T26DRAFT_727941 [Lasiosphaeria miniovina]|uniref:Uncharacterized protein n=1 Tax=Lasiosphaeria miniovina TaxID=1954250 RepID=A0AA40DKP4_9PEZI|nr:uncharacterized protein B0T26DRAFT_727941 [Lasiosphaeria miniovina]KAK0706760.1 hypothetical protein B0T26DRAFT_727941 [Lasiosphaeria miniovina]
MAPYDNDNNNAIRRALQGTVAGDWPGIQMQQRKKHYHVQWSGDLDSRKKNVISKEWLGKGGRE